ncbi:hypothetical protein MKW98_011806 [Papaver atlanticum]|uniref:Uncharacterized protein n=1 Tax=Papaver atlanticum TaxID=357466 RepID=A0AAD4XHQ6_9MAGN|nr:hypothetical protein MKW98_011806 [Papaver atlanticum]
MVCKDTNLQDFSYIASIYSAWMICASMDEETSTGNLGGKKSSSRLERSRCSYAKVCRDTNLQGFGYAYIASIYSFVENWSHLTGFENYTWIYLAAG